MRKEYHALKLVSHFMIVIGWAIIIFGWLFGFLAGEVWGNTFARIATGINGEQVASSRSIFVIISTGIFSTIYGILFIAAGQVFLVLLDIRNDIRSQMNLMRRFTKWYAETQSNEEAPETE